MAFYDCLKFVNEALFSVLVIAVCVLLASRQVITVGTVLTAYLCFTQLTGPLRELHRILDEFSECVVLADDYFQLLDLPLDFSYRNNGAPGGAKACGHGVTLRDVRFAYPEKPGPAHPGRYRAGDSGGEVHRHLPGPAAAANPRLSK